MQTLIQYIRTKQYPYKQKQLLQKLTSVLLLNSKSEKDYSLTLTMLKSLREKLQSQNYVAKNADDWGDITVHDWEQIFNIKDLPPDNVLEGILENLLKKLNVPYWFWVIYFGGVLLETKVSFSKEELEQTISYALVQSIFLFDSKYFSEFTGV